MSFNDGVRAGMFNVAGDRNVNFAPVFHFVRKGGYKGWIVVEAEQDASIAPPKTCRRPGASLLVRKALAPRRAPRRVATDPSSCLPDLRLLLTQGGFANYQSVGWHFCGDASDVCFSSWLP
jgi:hypothetical protein